MWNGRLMLGLKDTSSLGAREYMRDNDYLCAIPHFKKAIKVIRRYQNSKYKVENGDFLDECLNNVRSNSTFKTKFNIIYYKVSIPCYVDLAMCYFKTK
jgi:hypothetical protein